jgi:hypothetical protein
MFAVGSKLATELAKSRTSFRFSSGVCRERSRSVVLHVQESAIASLAMRCSSANKSLAFLFAIIGTFAPFLKFSIASLYAALQRSVLAAAAAR